LVSLDQSCANGGTIYVDGLDGDDSIYLLWCSDCLATLGTIADPAARAEYHTVLEECWNDSQKVGDWESYIYKADYLYADCEFAEVDGGGGNDVIRGTPAPGLDR